MPFISIVANTRCDWIGPGNWAEEKEKENILRVNQEVAPGISMVSLCIPFHHAQKHFSHDMKEPDELQVSLQGNP